MWHFFKRKRVELPQVPPPSPKWHITQTSREDNGLEVTEFDVSDEDLKELHSRTGVQRVFDRVTGKFK